MQQTQTFLGKLLKKVVSMGYCPLKQCDNNILVYIPAVAGVVEAGLRACGTCVACSHVRVKLPEHPPPGRRQCVEQAGPG